MLISRISILLSIIGLFIGITMQHHLFAGYQTATGKTQALYGLEQLAYIDYALLGLISLLLSVISIFKKENRKTIILTLSLSILSILIFVLEIWRLFI